MTDRTVILHYHLFKNAGTSFDRILKNNFPNRWETEEFPARGGNNSDLVAKWIRSKPDAVAFSSHTMLGPIPRIDGVKIISVLFLRDPLKRISSAYRFERGQALETFGPVLARATDLEGYVRVRLALPNDRQCRNFQTFRLASMAPGDGPDLERAIAALPNISIVGQVDAFGDCMTRLKAAISDVFPDFEGEQVHLNASAQSTPGKADDIDQIRDLLEDANRDDIALLEHARAMTRAQDPNIQAPA